MRTLLLAACLLSCLACSKDEKQSCSLDRIDNKSYSGTIRLCESQPGHFVEFDGMATLSILDSIIQIHLFSQDSLVSFDQLIMVTCECETLQDDTNWNFTDAQTQKDIGSAFGQGKYILLELQNGSCFDDQTFIGADQN